VIASFDFVVPKSPSRLKVERQACIAGGIAHAFYGKLPDIISAEVHSRLEVPLRQILTLFCDRFSCR